MIVTETRQKLALYTLKVLFAGGPPSTERQRCYFYFPFSLLQRHFAFVLLQLKAGSECAIKYTSTPTAARLSVGRAKICDVRARGPRRSISADWAEPSRPLSLYGYAHRRHNPYLDTKLPRLMFHPLAPRSSAAVFCFSAGDETRRRYRRGRMRARSKWPTRWQFWENTDRRRKRYEDSLFCHYMMDSFMLTRTFFEARGATLSPCSKYEMGVMVLVVIWQNSPNWF